jgi:hypothetical protein
MSYHPVFTAALLFCFAFLLHTPSAADEEAPALLEKRYRLDLPVRRLNEKEFTRDPRAVPADVFLDKKTQRLFYVGEEGKTLAVVPAARGGGGPKARPAKWLHRLVMPVRRWDDTRFGEETPKVSVEVYRDENVGNLVYVSHTGFLAVIPAGKAAEGEPSKPRSLYRLPCKVRPHGEWELKYHRYNVEVYQDDRTGALLYVAENGALAVIPAAKAVAGQKAEPPVWSHALELVARKPGDEEFGQHRTLWSMEVYLDESRGALLYVTETPQLAVLPGNTGLLAKPQAPRWLRRFRPAGDAARRWSGEVFVNPNCDHHVYITSQGAVAVVPTK